MSVSLEGWEADFKNFKNCLPDHYYFNRMKDYGRDYAEIDYKAFIHWNAMCFAGLNKTDRVWLAQLCSRINKGSINTMDMESCSKFTATMFFFDKNKEITISNPR